MELLIEAERQIANGNYAEAIAVLTKALDNPYVRAEALRVRGKLYFDLKEFEKSIADYTEAIVTKAPGINGIETGLRLRARTSIAMADYALALDDIQNLIDRAAKGDPGRLEDACDLIDEIMVERSKQTPLTKVELERLSMIVDFLANKVFREGDYGLIWSAGILKQLRGAD